MNILLLFVSTLHIPKDKETGINRTSIYSAYKDAGDIRENYPYVSQLEPGSKYFFNKLAAKNQKFGRVIALCTKETLDGVSFSVDGTEISYEDISAYEIYRRRMTAFLKGSDIHENKLFAEAVSKAKPDIAITPTGFCAPEMYNSDELSGLFMPVEISFDGSAFAENISNIVTAITEQTDEHIDLYFNAQGGLRTNVQIINAVLNMLQSRSVTLKEVSAINFSSKNRENPLIDETEHYLINDLAAALDAFLEYGRGDMFVKYYERYKRKRLASVGKGKFKGIPEQKIIDRIRDISDSIMLCNIKAFVKNIDLLRKAIDDYEISTDAKDRFFELIVSDIKESYGELMTEEGAKDLIAQTRWCLDKKLIQQALTLMESYAPRFMMENGFLYYQNNEDSISALSSFKTANEEGKLVTPPEMLDTAHFVVKNFINGKLESDEGLTIKNADKLKEPEELEAMKNGNYRLRLSPPGKKELSDKAINIGSLWLVHNDIKSFTVIMDKYKLLCDRRNDINHAKDNIKNPRDYKKEIDSFIEMLEKIKENVSDFPKYVFEPIEIK